MKKARVARGVYRCGGYNIEPHDVAVTVAVRGKGRIRNVAVDHIKPIVDPKLGFVSWDDIIRRMFVEEEGLQVLCKECHDKKTADERKQRNV